MELRERSWNIQFVHWEDCSEKQKDVIASIEVFAMATDNINKTNEVFLSTQDMLQSFNRSIGLNRSLSMEYDPYALPEYEPRTFAEKYPEAAAKLEEQRQESQLHVPPSYLLQAMGRNEEELKMPAPQPLPPMEVHPVPILSVLPPNIPQQDFLARAIAALETPLGVKRDLRFIMERYHNFVAANRGHTPKVLVQTSKGKSKSQAIKCWVDFVMYFTKKRDDLPTHFPELTAINSKTACNSYNNFWNTLATNLTIGEQPEMLLLRSSFYDCDEGVLCLASMSHTHRGLCLAHFAHKAQTREGNLAGPSKKNYLDAMMRFLKAYEVLYGVDHIYDTANWTWSSSWQYREVRPSLKSTTLAQDNPHKKGGNFSAYMTDKDFAQLNHFTYKLAQDHRHTNFREYLLIMQHWWIQMFLVFCCPRGGTELWEIEADEIKHTGVHRLTYTPGVSLFELTSHPFFIYLYFLLAVNLSFPDS